MSDSDNGNVDLPVSFEGFSARGECNQIAAPLSWGEVGSVEPVLIGGVDLLSSA